MFQGVEVQKVELVVGVPVVLGGLCQSDQGCHDGWGHDGQWDQCRVIDSLIFNF